VDLRETITAFLPWLVGAGALLLVVGVVLRLMAYGPGSKRWSSTISGYGLLTVLLALALWAILWFVEAWESGVIESIGK
jgi:protein-S-isoprenylcysteine O-methyltransferase Ste14